MSTIELAQWLQKLAEEKRSLKGRLQENKRNAEKNAMLKRYIRAISTELNSRQMRLKGF